MHRPNCIDGLREIVGLHKFRTDLRWIMIGMATLGENHRLHRSSIRCIHLVFSHFTTPDQFASRMESLSLGSLHKEFWVAFVQTSIEEFFSKTHLTFSLKMLAVQVVSETMATIVDVYRINDELPLRIINVGNWTTQDGVQINFASMTLKHSNLEGIQLRVAIKENWPVSFKTEKNGKFEWDGVFPVIWEQLMDVVNATCKYIEYEKTGSMRPDGSWSAMVGEALMGKADIIVSELTLDERRSRVLDFTQPLLKSRYQIFFKQPGLILDWMAVLKPFPMALWTAILVWVLGATISLTICYYICVRVGIEKNAHHQFNLLHFLFFTLQTLSQQGKEDVPRSVSCKILFFSSYLVSAIVIPAYSASLISSLTQKTPYRPFNSMQEMIYDGTFKLLVTNNTAEYDFFEYSNDPTVRLAYTKLIRTVPEEHKMKNSHHGIELVCDESKHYAMFGIESINIPWIQRDFPNCPVLTMTRPLPTVHIAMALPKGHPLHSIITQKLGLMTDVGIIRRMTETAWPARKSVKPALWTEVHTEEVFQIFVFLASAIILSICILAWEICFYKRNTKCDDSQSIKPQLLQLNNFF